MPYCTMCDAWSPGRASKCDVCGGALGGERPASAHVVGERPEAPQPAAADANLAEVDPGYTLPEARAIAAAYERVRVRAGGLAAAPASWLPAPGAMLASALQVALGQDPDRAGIVRFKEGMVDLQAFLPDGEAEAGQRAHAGNARDEEDRRIGEAALETVLVAQANAICWLRNDERVLGAVNALRPLHGVTVGEAERALAAVDRYKESQTAGFLSMTGGPIAVVVGGFLGTLLLGFTAVGAVVTAVLAGAYILLGPVVGLVVGQLSSRARRAALRVRGDSAAAATSTVVEVLGMVALFLVPAVLGFAAIGVCQSLGLA
jgi:hypothetical protein